MKRRIITSLVGCIALLLMVAGCDSDDGDSAQIESVAVDGTEGQAEPSPAEAPTDGDEPRPSPEATPVEPEPEAPEEVLGAMLLIMDASGSMNAEDSDGQTLIAGAKRALIDVVEGLPDEQHVGLRVYGHRYPNTDKENGCTDTELIHPVEPLDRGAMVDTINGYEAKGYTPIGLSLEEGAKDLPPEGERAMVLVSDGEETCDVDACEVAERVREEGIDLVIHTVGFALGDNDQARRELECIAEAGGGDFVDVAEARDLASTLQEIAQREARRVEISGQRLEGAPIPRDANTGRVGMTHIDTVLSAEENYYRFEIEPGSQVRAELVRPAGESRCDRFVTRRLSAEFTGADTREYKDPGHRGAGDMAGPDDDQVVQTVPVTVDADEVYLKIRTNSNCEDDQYEVEFQVTTVD